MGLPTFQLKPIVISLALKPCGRFTLETAIRQCTIDKQNCTLIRRFLPLQMCRTLGFVCVHRKINNEMLPRSELSVADRNAYIQCSLFTVAAIERERERAN